MKEIIHLLQEKELIFKSLNPIEAKILGSRKKISIYLGVDLKKYYACIIHLKKKSRVVSKEVMELIEFHKKLDESKQINHYIELVKERAYSGNKSAISTLHFVLQSVLKLSASPLISSLAQ